MLLLLYRYSYVLRTAVATAAVHTVRTWKSRPSGENVFTPRSYSLLKTPNRHSGKRRLERSGVLRDHVEVGVSRVYAPVRPKSLLYKSMQPTGGGLLEEMG